MKKKTLFLMIVAVTARAGDVEVRIVQEKALPSVPVALPPSVPATAPPYSENLQDNSSLSIESNQRSFLSSVSRQSSIGDLRKSKEYNSGRVDQVQSDFETLLYSKQSKKRMQLQVLYERMKSANKNAQRIQEVPVAGQEPSVNPSTVPPVVTQATVFFERALATKKTKEGLQLQIKYEHMKQWQMDHADS